MNEKFVLNQTNTTKKKNSTLSKIVPSILGFLLIAMYLLADRYLIEHVEMEAAVVPSVPADAGINLAESAENAADVPISKTVGEEFISAESLPEIIQPTESAATEQVFSEPVYIADKAAGLWTYQDASSSITIQRVSQGSGTDTVTYFVADVQLSDAATLQSAFAKNKFGTNIIEKVTTIAANNRAVFAVNGDYYGFRSDGIIIRNGVIYRNVPARVGLAIFDDGTMQIYDERTTDAETLISLGVINTLSFGPALIQNGVVETDFDNTMIDSNFGNRTIDRANPRTGIGMIDENHFVFIVADGRSKGYSRGLTLDELAQIFADLGCIEAYNIDGGGSSAMYFMGDLVNNPLGKQKERGTSDILFIAGEDETMNRLAMIHE